MLKKTQRLSRKEFEKLLSQGKKKHQKDVTLVYMNALSTKTGVIVSKKTAKKATQRNFIRRRIFAVLKNHHNLYEKKHIVIITKPNSVRLSQNVLKEQIIQILQNI